jgi:hypothetical protein
MIRGRMHEKCRPPSRGCCDRRVADSRLPAARDACARGGVRDPADAARSAWLRGLHARDTLIYVAVATLPAFAFYGYGAFVARYFEWKLTSSFMTSLYGHREYWQGWLGNAIGHRCSTATAWCLSRAITACRCSTTRS